MSGARRRLEAVLADEGLLAMVKFQHLPEEGMALRPHRPSLPASRLGCRGRIECPFGDGLRCGMQRSPAVAETGG